MLSRLSIRNIVLIDRLELDFNSGLSVLTGETGAGKSILLDAFSLALGGRGDGNLVRHGESQGQITATFEIPSEHPAWIIATESGVEYEDQLILRRVQLVDGRTRAYVNDTSVTVQTLKDIGSTLVEIHGQHADRALMDAAAHRSILDAFATLHPEAALVEKASSSLRSARTNYAHYKKDVERILKEADYLQHSVEELRHLAAQPGEETDLALLRQSMMHAEKLTQDLNEAYETIGGPSSVIPHFSAILRKLERRQELAPTLLDPAIKILDEVLDTLNEAQSVLQNSLSAAEFDPSELERIEERLFALRAAARKYNIVPDELPALQQRFEEEIKTIEAGEGHLAELEQKVAAADSQYITVAQDLSQKRKQAALILSQTVDTELPPLKLEHAKFIVDLNTNESTRDPSGFDRVEFWAQTNPGTRPGPLMKVASGGELSRFMLALKVVLADKGSAPTLIFDEIDSGVGGAVADAIGSRLARLAHNVQVIAVTHAPQVAARANHHFLITKQSTEVTNRVETKVHLLSSSERQNEIARMLAGAHITEEARAAAAKLLDSAKTL